MHALELAGPVLFLSTLSLRRATANGCTTVPNFRYFYPRSPCGERQFQMLHQVRHMQFLSTLSLRRATDTLTDDVSTGGFLSTLSLRRATNNYVVTRGNDNVISIHALLAESDWLQLFLYYQDNGFLSTLSLRRATLAGPSGPAFLYNFYPRSPCGERQ